MLALISPLITHGIVDNTVPGLIDLRLWCTDEKEPLHIRLAGDCLRDIAGCRIKFTNPTPTPVKDEPELLHSLRHEPHRFTAGDITFSRRVPDTDNRAAISNYLYIEFFVNTDKRILLEFNSPRFEISLPQWEQSWADDNVQQLLNRDALRAHIRTNVAQYKGPSLLALQNGMPPCHWDYTLNRAEAYMAIYPTIHAKYGPEPGGYLSAAYVMDRVEFLGKLASEDEAHMPPDDETMSKDWEVTDFLSSVQAKAVQRAMHHRMFKNASRMTILVQSLIINGDEKTKGTANATVYLNTYAGIVSHLLATLLLTEEKEFEELAIARLRKLILRIDELENHTNSFPEQTAAVLNNAAQKLRNNMSSLLETLHR